VHLDHVVPFFVKSMTDIRFCIDEVMSKISVCDVTSRYLRINNIGTSYALTGYISKRQPGSGHKGGFRSCTQSFSFILQPTSLPPL